MLFILTTTQHSVLREVAAAANQVIKYRAEVHPDIFFIINGTFLGIASLQSELIPENVLVWGRGLRRKGLKNNGFVAFCYSFVAFGFAQKQNTSPM